MLDELLDQNLGVCKLELLDMFSYCNEVSPQIDP